MESTEQATGESEEARKKRDDDHRFGRQIAYGIQQTIACWATDFIDPPVSKFLQNTFGNKKYHVTNAHTFGGEAIGDTAAFGIYLFAKRFFGKPIDGVIGGVKRLANPILAKMGKSAIKPWAETHGVEEGDARYQQKLEEYKDFQSENMVDSSIISAAATGVNVLAQRQLGNQQKYTTILGSKVVGATLTLGLMAGLRVLFPTSTRTLDDEISDRYSSKLIKWTKKTLGVKEEDPAEILAQPALAKSLSGNISPEKREGLMSILVEDTVKINYRDPAEFGKLVAQQKAFYQAFYDALDPAGPLVDVIAREHYAMIEKNHQSDFDHYEASARQRDRDASHASVLRATAEKRDELRQFMALLDDPKFLEEAKATAAAGKMPEIREHVFTVEEKEALTHSLLAAARPNKNPVAGILDEALRREMEYNALSHAHDPEGIAARIMVNTMKKLLPDRNPQDVEKVSKDYMRYYSKEAAIMAQAMQADGEVVQNATSRAKHLHDEYRGASHTTMVTAI
ncbi:MAG: hypothetical protein SFX19_06600 [Alphaproteobacteria bacterium]|nr:hypothetical protein [Alphaproteobacteria bacterium]